MIHCTPADEPADFDEQVRKPGRAWLRQHPNSTSRPPAYWRRCNAPLAEAFEDRCAYTAMFLGAPGTVDHFVSIDENRRLAYRWSNYRYAAGWINSRKQELRSRDLLDPFRVGDGWFELLLPSLQLRVSDRCPTRQRALAERTLKKLGLRDDERVLRYRRKWLGEYERAEISLRYLARKAPLIARAVEKWERENGRKWAPVNPPSTKKSPSKAVSSRAKKPAARKSTRRKPSGRTTRRQRPR